MNKLENLKKKILYRSAYRGTKEMDILLTSFVNRYINVLNENELNELDNFLSQEDDIIYELYKNKTTDKKEKQNKIYKLFKSFKI